MACWLLLKYRMSEKSVGRLTAVYEKGDGIVANQVAAKVWEEVPPAEKKKSFPQVEERTTAFLSKENELGLLDIVFMDAIFKRDAVRKL